MENSMMKDVIATMLAHLAFRFTHCSCALTAFFLLGYVDLSCIHARW